MNAIPVWNVAKAFRDEPVCPGSRFETANPMCKSPNTLPTILILVLVFGQRLFSQSLDSSTGAPSVILTTTKSSQATSDIQQLIKSLGDENFEVRERSSTALLEIGTPALAELRQLQAETSKEIRQRASSLLAEIEKRNLIAASRKFLSDSGSENSHGLPAWDAFKAMSGSGSRPSKLLYLEMLKANYALAQQIETLYLNRLGNKDTAQLEAELTQAINARSNVFMKQLIQGAGIGIGQSVAVLLAVSMLDTAAPIEASNVVYYSVQRGFFDYLAKPSFRPCLLNLLSQWIPKAHDSFAPEILRMGFTLDLPAVLPLARRYLSDTFDKNTRELALYDVAKYGDLSDVPMLLKLTHDTEIIHELDESRGGIIMMRAVPPGLPPPQALQPPLKLVRVNDMAIVAGMILLGEDLETLFPGYSKDAFLRRELSALAIEPDQAEARNGLIKAWASKHLDESLDD